MTYNVKSSPGGVSFFVMQKGVQAGEEIAVGGESHWCSGVEGSFV